MRLSNIREAPCIRANLLLNQANTKKGFKAIQPEIGKMSEIFGIEFDKHLYKSLFDEIDFKDLKSLLNNKNASNKIQYFIQEFPFVLDRLDFINIFSQILMSTSNISPAQEIFEGLNKITKLSYENQFKIIISFFYSMNERFSEDAKNILISKCHELHKEGKSDQLSQSTVETLLLLINSLDVLKSDTFFTNTFVNFIMQSTSFSQYQDYNASDELKQISEIENLLDATGEEAIEFEKILNDLGPLMVNNMVSLRSEMVDCRIDERRLVSFILFLCKHQNWVEDKENRYLNKVFLKSLSNELAMNIDESSEKKFPAVSWNIENLFKIYKTSLENLDMWNLATHFDDPMFCIKDKKTFDYFLMILQKLKVPNINALLFNLIFKKWNSELNQIEFLTFLINNPPVELFSFKNSTGKKVKKNFELSISLNKNNLTHLIEAWSCIDLIEVLLKLSKGNYYMKVKEIFEWPIANIPEILVLALAVIKADGDDFMYDEIIAETLPLFLGNHVNALTVLEEVWNLNKEMIIKTICNMYRSNPDLMNLSRILDITQKLKESLIPIVSCNDHTFTVNLAILAVKRDFLHIDQWLAERISKVGDDFIECVLNYIKENVIAHCKEVTSPTIKENILEKCQLSLESLAIIFENLTPNKIGKNSKVTPRIEQEITNTYKAIFEIFDELQVQPPNSEEIEEAANKLYQSLFKSEITVEEIIEKMKTFKNSQLHKESEIYACMIHSVLDEYRFFHLYPEKELITIATFFGQIINQKLLDGIIETIALKYVLEGIKKGFGNMFLFGTTALDQFVDKLHLWPQYLTSLTEIKSLKTVPLLYDKVSEKLNEMANKNKKIAEESGHKNSGNIVVNNSLAASNVYNPIISFEDEKKLNTLKMPEIPKKDFVDVLKGLGNPVSQGGMSTSATGRPKQNAEPAPLNVNPYSELMVTQPVYYPSKTVKRDDPFEDFSDMNKYSQTKIEDDKKLKQDLDADYINLKPQNERLISFPQTGQGILNLNPFNSGDNKTQASTKTKLSKPVQLSTGIGNIPQILVNETESTVTPPLQDIIDSITFIFNSMSKSNVNEKSNELKRLLANDNNIFRWFSNFFIVNRVSAENNNHQIYNEFISLIDSKELNQLLIKDTILFIKKFLQSENLAKDLKEKNILKNLGSWLGIMTLAKNKPVLAKDLDLKEIIFDAYENGKLSAITNFVARILEHSQKTKVFHPKNPWIQAILAVLAELNSKPNLKHNLKFEIENLFKKLEVDLNSYTPSQLLDELVVCPNSPDFTKPQASAAETPSEGFKLQELFSRISSLEHYLSEVLSFINGRSLNPMGAVSKQELVTILTTALTNAINEIIAPVVERAVNISQLTTRELILKDFAFEKDEMKFKNAANLCIKSLAGSLAMVTCKEPLRIGYNSQLKDLLSKKGMDTDLIESMNNSINNSDILEIGCNYIENYVIKRAIDKNERDKVIIDELEKRRKNKALDIKPELLNKIKILPEVLRPSTCGLSQEQYKIYEDFEKDTVDFTSKCDSSHQNKNSFLRYIVPALQEVLDSYQTLSSHNIGKLPNKYEICMVNIKSIARSNEGGEYGEEDDQISVLSKNIVESKISDYDIALELATITLKYAIAMFKSRNLSLANVYSEIIRGWAKLHSMLSKEMTKKILCNEDISIRFHCELNSYFYKKQIFDLSDYESYLCVYLDDSAMNTYVRKLLGYLLEKNLINLTTFKKIPSYVCDPNVSGNFYDLFAKKSNYCASNPNFYLIDFKTCNIKDQSTFSRFGDICKFAYNQMINSMYPFQSYDVEKVRQKMKDFIDSSFVKNDEQMNVFIMIITELAIKGELMYDEANIIYPENAAKCIIGLLNIIPTATSRLKVFENILFGIFKVLHYDYVKSMANFNQKPYYKLFFNIIYLLQVSDPGDEMYNGGYKKLQFFGILADILRVLCPCNYPGFALAWIDLVSCKYFSSAFLEIDPYIKLRENIPKYEKYLFLVNDLLAYLKSFSSEAMSNFSAKIFIDDAYKFMFLISTSFPEFLSYYYYILLASLPPGDNFLQMKNIILHSAPSDIEQPDPFLDDLKVDSLPDVRKNSIVLFDIASILHDYGFKMIIDEYIDTKNDIILEELMKKLNNNKKDKDQSNYYVINAIVIYCFKAFNERKRKSTEVFDFYQKMMKNLDQDNRDHLINSIINELRYPSNQTYYFSCLLLFIICDIKNESIEEHILRNILERLLYKPYPWGLIVTFVQLWNNPKYEHAKKGYINKNQSDKNIEDLLKFIKTSKMNKNLDNYA